MSTQEPNTVASHSAVCICSRNWKAKPIVSIYFVTQLLKFCFRIISFSSLESELSFDLKDSEINLDQAHLTRALTAIWSISSDDREDLIADELVVY